MRVYPDDLHIDSHEENLTAPELEWGQRYWTLIWPAAGDQATQQSAWDKLVERFGARRAAWVVRQTTPANLSQRPAAGSTTPAPVFPLPRPLKADDWTLPALARLLPDRWVVMGYVAGRGRVLLEAGAPIPEGLAVSPAPDSPAPLPAGAGEEQLALDEGMRWLVDFEQAEKVGMGIRIILPGDLEGATFERLFVFGVKAGLDPANTAAALEAHLDGHHYTRGLEFVAPGRATNNSPAAGTGASRRAAEDGKSFQIEIQPPALTPESDGALAARLLGVNPEIFTPIEGAALGENQDARHMATALWPVTGAYYLDQVLAQPEGQPAAFTPEQIDAARHYFIDFVRHAGPLPALRVGRQPYGLLPVESLDLVGSFPNPQEKFVLGLLRMQDVFSDTARRAERLQPGAPNADELVEILRMQPVSAGFRARPVFDTQFFVPTGVMQRQLDPLLKVHANSIRERLRQLSVEQMIGAGRIFDLLPSGASTRLGAALVQAGGEIPGAPLSPNYIAFLRTARFDDILNEQFPSGGDLQGQPDALLYLLLRQSVLLAYLQVDQRILARRGSLPAAPLREPVLVDILGSDRPVRTRTLLRILDLDPNLRASLHTLTAAQEPEAAALDELRASLAHLETLPVDKLARQMCGTLDLFAYRFDAWITSLATQRLLEIRQAQPRGLTVGGYAWIENLSPLARTPVTATPPGETGAPLFAAREPGGFIHAPSISQAAAAGVMRSGYLSQPGEGGSRPFAVDLSSQRVRLAEFLLDGIRQGQPLGALLGYRFERGLHDHHLDRFIEGFRRVSLLAAIYQAQEFLREMQALPGNSPGKLAQVRAAQRALSQAIAQLKERYQFPPTASVETLESISAARVADGLALSRLFASGGLSFDHVVAPGANPVSDTERIQLESELAGLQAAVDALSDALTAEFVYQMVQGNPTRAAASVDSVVHSEVQPPELTFNRTPRPAMALLHRLATLFSGPIPAALAAPRAFRANAEPRLNAWLRQMLGEVRNVRCQAEFLKPDGTRLGPMRTLALSALGINPLDAVHLCAAAQPGQPSELERLLEYFLRSGAPANVPADARLRLIYARPATGISEAQLSLGEFLEVAGAYRRLILAVRPLAARDLAPAGAQVAPTIDAPEFQARIDRAVDALRQTLGALAAQRQQAAISDADPIALASILKALRERLLDLFFLGFSDALPLSPRGSTAGERDILVSQSRAIEKVAGERLAQIETAEAAFDRAASDVEAQVQFDLARLRLVFGKAFLALPNLRPSNAQELSRAFNASDALQGGNGAQALSWLQGVARVRPSVSSLDAALSFAAALGRASALELRVAQLPFQTGDRWIALPFVPDKPPRTGATSLVAHLPRPFRAAQPLAGFVVDEWIESVPTGEVPTGVSFQFDAPGARPPQAVLLTCLPPGAKRWQLEFLEQTFREVLDMSHRRALDPQVLGEDSFLQRILPAIYVSLNLAGDTVSTDFGRAIR